MLIYLFSFCFFFLFSQGWSYRISDPTRSREGSVVQKPKDLVLFLSDRKYRRGNPPSTSLLYPKLLDQNFEMAIFLGTVEKSINYVFEDNLTPQSHQGRAASYEPCSLLTYNIGYWEAWRYSRGRDFMVGVLTWKDITMEGFSWREGIFQGRGSWIFQYEFKKLSEIKQKKTSFSHWK